MKSASYKKCASIHAFALHTKKCASVHAFALHTKNVPRSMLLHAYKTTKKCLQFLNKFVTNDIQAFPSNVLRMSISLIA